MKHDATQTTEPGGSPLVRQVRPQPTGKWCTYCRKHDHNDDECYCTRALPASWVPTPAMSMEIFREATAAAARDRAQHMEASLRSLMQALDAGSSLDVAAAMANADELLGPNVRANLDPTA